MSNSTHNWGRPVIVGLDLASGPDQSFTGRYILVPEGYRVVKCDHANVATMTSPTTCYPPPFRQCLDCGMKLDEPR